MRNDDEKEKGEGRSASRPRERLNFLTVLSLDLDDASQRMHNVLAHSAYSTMHKYNSERFYDTDRRPRSSSKPAQQST